MYMYDLRQIDSTGKLNEGSIIGTFLFKINQKFTKTIEKRMGYLQRPNSWVEKLKMVLFGFLWVVPVRFFGKDMDWKRWKGQRMRRRIMTLLTGSCWRR